MNQKIIDVKGGIVRMDSVLNVLLERMEMLRADELLQSDEIYLTLMKDIDVAQAEIENSVELNNLLDAYNSATARQSELMYKQGMLDCIELLKELKIL